MLPLPGHLPNVVRPAVWPANPRASAGRGVLCPTPASSNRRAADEIAEPGARKTTARNSLSSNHVRLAFSFGSRQDLKTTSISRPLSSAAVSSCWGRNGATIELTRHYPFGMSENNARGHLPSSSRLRSQECHRNRPCGHGNGSLARPSPCGFACTCRSARDLLAMLAKMNSSRRTPCA